MELGLRRRHARTPVKGVPGDIGSLRRVQTSAVGIATSIAVEMKKERRKMDGE